MEMKMTKRFAALAMAAALCMSFAAPQAWAAAADATATIELAPVKDQNAVEVTIKAGDEGTDAAPSLKNVSTFSLALDIEVLGDNADNITASFAFSDAVKALNPTILRPSGPMTVPADSGKLRMNVYVAGVQNAFAGKTLDVGRVYLSVPEGVTAEARVSVPDVANALSVVDSGTYTQTDVPDEDLFVPEKPTITIGATTNPPVIDKQPNTDADRNDIVGQTPDTNPNKTNLSATGDTLMPVIVGLVCVAAVAAVVIVVMVVRKKKADKHE